MSKITIIEPNSAEKDNVKGFFLKGETGMTAYELAVKNGYTGSESDWINAHLDPDYYYTKTEIDTKTTTLSNSISNEATTRENADTTLQGLITDETSNRETDIERVETSISTEATTRENADNSLQSQINSLKNKGVLMAKLSNDVTVTGQVGDWVNYDIPVESSISAGNGLSVANNKIVIGSGISKIKVSAMVTFLATDTYERVLNARYFVIKNSGWNNCTTGITVSDNQRCSMVIPNQIVNVNEGDTVGIGLTCCKDDVIYSYDDATYLTVEVIE